MVLQPGGEDALLREVALLQEGLVLHPEGEGLLQLSPRVPIKIEGTVCCVTYVETYLILYHNIYFFEQAIYFAMIHIAPISRCSICSISFNTKRCSTNAFLDDGHQ